MNYDAVRFGHQATGGDGAAVGLVSEYDVTRAYGPYVISGLQRVGDSVINVTPPEANRSLSDSLMYGINLANKEGVDRFISCHANCADSEQAHGCEVIYLSSAGKVLAESICKEISALGFYNRGAKPDERGLAELHKTDAVAVIIEPFFISSPSDVELYKQIGPEKLGYAIVKGITGKEVIEKPVVNTKTTGSYRVITGTFGNKQDADNFANKLKSQGTTAYVVDANILK